MTLYQARCRSCAWRCPESPLGQVAALAMLHSEATATAGVFSPDLRRGHTVLVEWGERGRIGRRYSVRGFFRVPAIKEAGSPPPLRETRRAEGPNSH